MVDFKQSTASKHSPRQFDRVAASLAPIGIALALGLATTPVLASEFCDQLKMIVAASPNFSSLRGDAEGSQYNGALLVQTADQCKIRNKSDFDTNWSLINEKWSYECLWGPVDPKAHTALKALVGECFPQSTYTEGSPLAAKYKNFTGGFFRLQDASLVLDFNKDTYQLWLTVLPSGVEQ